MTIEDIVEFLEELPRRIRVLLTNLLTYLVAAQTVVALVVAQGDALDLPYVGEYGTVALTGLASVILFVRRVTPVAAEERGLI
jgi:hypothetical protein